MSVLICMTVLDIFTNCKRRIIALWILTITLTVFSLPALYSFSKPKIEYSVALDERFNYLDSEVIEGLKYLGSQKDQRVILDLPMTNLGLVIPTYTKGRMYVGRWLLTENYAIKVPTGDAFFLRMNKEEQEFFLRQNNINYIVWTILNVKDKNINEFKNPPFLKTKLEVKEVFANSKIKIFKFAQ